MKAYNRDTLGLAAYLAFVVAATSIHLPSALAAMLAIAIAAGGRAAPRIVARAARATLPFSLLVILPWWLVHGGEAAAPYALRTGLRIATIATASFVFIARIDLLRAVRFSPTLAWLLALTHSQILVLQRAAADFDQAFASRCIVRPRLRDRLRHAAALAALLVATALRQAEEVALAMRSRGFFDA